MIAALIAASLASHGVIAPTGPAAPCQVVPALCMTSEEGAARPVIGRGAAASDNKMSAYRFNARPCRIIGNLDCPKQARLQLFRLGEPVLETLARSFTPR